MAIADDFSIAANGDIRYTGTTANYTVLAFHRWLQDLADDADTAVSGDIMYIVEETPSARSTNNIITLVNGYNITATEAQHLYDGSITQGSGITEEKWQGLVVVGAVVSGTSIQIVQADATPLEGAIFTNFWDSVPNADAANNILLRIMVKTRDAGLDINQRRLIVQAREFNDTYAEFLVQMNDGNNVAALFTSDDLNNDTAAGTVDAYDKFTNIEGYQAIDIAGDGDSSNEHYYAQWDIVAGTLPAATATLGDLYEWTKSRTRTGSAFTIHGIDSEVFRGITHEIDYQTQTVGNFVEDDYVVWGTILAFDAEASGPFAIGDKLTFDAGGANNGPIYGQLLALQDDVGTTGVMVVQVETAASIVNNDTISNGTASALVDGTTRLTGVGQTGGAGIILADDDNGTTGTLWIQQTMGAAPVDTQVLWATDGTVLTAAPTEAVVNVTVAAKTVSPEFLGTFTGSALIGAFGIGMNPNDTTSSDLFFPLEGGTVSPPNNVTFTVFGLVSGEDRVLVTNNSGGAPDFTQMATDTTLTANPETAISINPAPGIPTETPSPTGTVRVELDSGSYARVAYTAVDIATDTFTISHDFSGDAATAPANVFISYIDKLAASTSESFTTVYTSPRTLFIRVRDGGTAGDLEGIVTFETTSALGSGGGSATANRISDV